MALPRETTTTHYCNQMAIARGLDPVGHAGDYDDAIIVEVPLPWKRDIREQSGLLPDEMLSLYDLWLQHYHEGKGYPHRALLIAPDEAYSQMGDRRVMFYKRPDGFGSQFRKVEYLVPEAKLGQLIWSLYETPQRLPEFERYIVPHAEDIRDILVCTHGAVDVVCGKFGYPLYKNLRDHDAGTQLRVWRVSHFGGHVFAPTLMDMPSGHYWAYVQDEQIAPIVEQTGAVAAMRGHFRGSAMIGNSWLQVLDCEMWQRVGWEWFTYEKAGHIIAVDDSDPPQWAEVEIHYRIPHNVSELRVQARIEVSHTVETQPSTGKSNAYPYAQYVITDLQRLV